jgi:hypothetical protein
VAADVSRAGPRYTIRDMVGMKREENAVRRVESIRRPEETRFASLSSDHPADVAGVFDAPR